MSQGQGPSMPTRGGRGPGWQWQRTGAPVGLAGVDGETSANATMEESLCVVQRETEEKARARTLASSSGSLWSSRFCLKSASASSLVPGAARRVLGKDQSSFASSAPTRRSSARTSHGEQASSGTSGREPKALAIARTGSVQQARAEQHEAARTWSGFGAMTRRSPGNIQDGDDCHTGLVELTCGKRSPDDRMTGHLQKHKGSVSCHFYHPKEFAVRWSMNNDDISYPLYAEIIGQADPSIKLRKEWDDIRVARKLRPLRDSEKRSSQDYYQMIHRDKNRVPNPIYRFGLEEPKGEERLGGFKIPENLVCPLCSKVLVDPVTIATGKTFDRECLRAWIDKNGHICPL